MFALGGSAFTLGGSLLAIGPLLFGGSGLTGLLLLPLCLLLGTTGTKVRNGGSTTGRQRRGCILTCGRAKESGPRKTTDGRTHRATCPLSLLAVLAHVGVAFAQAQRRLDAILLQRHLHLACIGGLDRPSVSGLTHLEVIRASRLLGCIRESHGNLPRGRHVQGGDANGCEELLFLLALQGLLGRRVCLTRTITRCTTTASWSIGIEIRRLRAKRQTIQNHTIAFKVRIRGRLRVSRRRIRFLLLGGRRPLLVLFRRTQKRRQQRCQRKCADCLEKCHIASLPYFRSLRQ